MQLLRVTGAVCQKPNTGRLRHGIQKMFRIGNKAILQQTHRQLFFFLFGKKSATLSMAGNRLGRAGHAHMAFLKNDHVIAKRRFVHVSGRHHDKHVPLGGIFAQDAPQVAS